MKRFVALAAFLALILFCFGMDSPIDEYSDVQYQFKGGWYPDVDPALLGPENFKTLQNMRYTDLSIQGVSGYTKINTTALATHPRIRSGIQLQSTRDTRSYVLTQAYDSSLSSSAVFLNTASIPDQGDFNATVVHTDVAGSSLGSFAKGPSGSVVYCNGKETMIWSGDAMRVSGFFTVSDGNGTTPRDWTDKVNNDLKTNGEVAVLGSQTYWYVLSTRPLQGVRYEIGTVNSASSTTTCRYWNGTDFRYASGFSDGTSSGGKSLAVDGEMSFDSTVSDAKPKHFQGLYLYCYLFQVSAVSATASISHAACDAPWQEIKDVWDGVYRQPIGFHIYRNSKWGDYTGEVNKESTDEYPITAELGGLTSSDYLYVIFQNRMSGIHFNMMSNSTNTASSTMTVQYWNGNGWVAAQNLNDGTSVGGKSLGQTGLVTWLPPDSSEEFSQELFDVTGYVYKISWSNTLTETGNTEATQIDLVTGVPAQLDMPVFKVTALFKDMLFLLNNEAGKEGNVGYYSTPNAPDVFNGESSSDDGRQAIYFGGSEPVVSAAQLYNRYGSNIYSTLVVLKKNETYLLNGDSPQDFKVYPISTTVGCAAPLTVASAEIGFEMKDDVTRNVIMWLSYAGPVQFDGGVINHLKDVAKYFDPTDDDCVNYAAIENARGWYDSTYKEYNLLLPTGTSTACNTWLVYDLVRKKWFRKDTGSSPMPQCGFAVASEVGTRYIYGGIDTGHLMRLDNGPSWDGAPITQIVETGDFTPLNNLWRETRVRYLQVIAKRIPESHTLAVSHVGDTEVEGVDLSWVDTGDYIFTDTTAFTWTSGAMATMGLSLASSLATLVDAVQPMNKLARFHRFRFEVSTDDTDKGFQPVAWGIQVQDVRDVR